MYLIRFLPTFAAFCVFLWISRDFADLPQFRGSATTRNIRSPALSSLVIRAKRWPGLLNIVQFLYNIKQPRPPFVRPNENSPIIFHLYNVATKCLMHHMHIQSETENDDWLLTWNGTFQLQTFAPQFKIHLLVELV